MKSTPNRSWLLLTACCLSTASTIGLLPGRFNAALFVGATPSGTSQPGNKDQHWKELYQRAVQAVDQEIKERESGFYSKSNALKQINDALEAAKAFGEQDPRVADALMLRNKYLRACNNFGPEECTEALKIRQHAFGAQSPKVAETLNGLAEVYAHTQKYAEAIDSYNTSLSIMEHNHGAGALQLAQSLNKSCHRGLAGAGDIKRMLLRVLRSIEKISPANQAAIAEVSSALSCGQPISSYPPDPLTSQHEAIERAIQIAEKSNPNSLVLAEYLESEARLYAASQDWTNAVKSYRKVVSIREQLASANCGLMSRTYRQMSDYLVSAKKIDEAEKYAKQAFSVWQKNPGDSYINMLNALHGIVAFYSGIQQPAKEIPYYKQIIDIDLKQNRHRTDSAAQLAKLYMTLGQYSDAEPLLKICVTELDDSAKSHGTNYRNYDPIPFVLMLATAATQQRHFDEAKGYFERVKNYFDHEKYSYYGDKYPKDLLQAYTEYLLKSGQMLEYAGYKARLEKQTLIETRACPGCGMG